MKAYLRTHETPIYAEDHPTVILLSRRGTHFYNTLLENWYRVDFKPLTAYAFAWRNSTVERLSWKQFRQYTGYRGVLEYWSAARGLRWLQKIVDWCSPLEKEANWAPPRMCGGSEEDYARETKAVLDRGFERDAPPDQTR